MKKRIWQTAVLALCLIALIGIVIWRNHKEAVTVQEKYHERDAACDASFMMWSMERDGIQYGFDQRGFTEEEAISCMMEVEESIDTIRTQMKDVDSFSQDAEMQILVLEDVSTVTLSGAEGGSRTGQVRTGKGRIQVPSFFECLSSA